MKTFVVCYLIIGVAVSVEMSATERLKDCQWRIYDALVAVVGWPVPMLIDVFLPINKAADCYWRH